MITSPLWLWRIQLFCNDGVGDTVVSSCLGEFRFKIEENKYSSFTSDFLHRISTWFESFDFVLRNISSCWY